MARLQKYFYPFHWLLIISLTGVFTWRPLSGGVDFWAHAAVGRWIAEHHQIPRHTLFLWSSNAPWIAHSWLSQLTFFELIHWGNPALVLAFCVFVNCVMIALIWYLWLRCSPRNALFPAIVAFGIWCANARFNPRPELFSAFFEVIILIALALRHQKYFSSRRLWWFIPLFALWTNLHGGMVMGLVLLAITVIAEFAQYYFQKQSQRSNLFLAVLFIGCIAATFINPFGLHYWHAITQVNGALFALIDEWKSPFVAPALPLLAIFAPLLLAVIALFCWLGNSRKQWAQLGWLALSIFMFIDARRNLEFIAIVALIVIAANGQTLNSIFQSISRKSLMAFVTMYVTSFLVTTAIFKSYTPLAHALPRVVADVVLQQEEALLQKHNTVSFRSSGAPAKMTHYGISAITQQENANNHLRIFNDYLNSSYFQWRFAGHPPLYIDLLNAYPVDLLQKYFSILRADAKGIDEFENLHVNMVVFGPYTAKSRQYPLARYLDNNLRWERIYHAEDGSVWRRKNTFTGLIVP